VTLLLTSTHQTNKLTLPSPVEWVGYIGRALSSKENPNYTLGPYIMQTLLLLVAPALFAASIYMVLGRIILLADAEHLSPIRRKWLTKAFVTGDVFSFCLQAAGGGIQAGGGNMYKTGENIILAGLVLQIIFFGLFMVVSITFHTRIAKRPTVASQGYHSIWSKQIWVLYAASLLILVRSAFRVVEYGMGNAGYLLRHEVFLYVFDAVLMFLVMVIFNIFHPSVLNVQKSSKQRMMNDGLLLNEVPTTSR